MDQLLSNFPDSGELLEPTVLFHKNVEISNRLNTGTSKPVVVQNKKQVEVAPQLLPTGLDPDLVQEHEKKQRKVRRRLQ